MVNYENEDANYKEENSEKSQENIKDYLKDFTKLILALITVLIHFAFIVICSLILIPLAASINFLHLGELDNDFIYILWFIVSAILSLFCLAFSDHLVKLKKDFIDKMKLFSQMVFFGFITYFTFVGLDVPNKAPKELSNYDLSLKVLPVITSISIGSYTALITYLFKDRDE